MNKKKIYQLTYSNALTPPPYLYRLDIRIEFLEKGVWVEYAKNFLNREDFSEEELEEEGFSLHDDFKVDVQLPFPWKNYFETLVASDQWSDNKAEDTLSNVISLQSPEHSAVRYRVLPQAEYQMEEVYQALLETANEEAPLSIELKKNANGQIHSVECRWSFKERIFEVREHNKKAAKTWDEGRVLLGQFYETDLSELPVHRKKLPENQWCINPGDGLWYELPLQQVQAIGIETWLTA